MERTGTTYTIRRAAEADLLAIVRLHNNQQDSADVPLASDPSPVQRRTWQQMMATSNLTVYVAERGGEIVGNTCMTIVPNLINGCRPTAFIEPMLVAATHRRRGVGRLMAQQLLDDARAAGGYKIQLLSHKRHATDGAHSFYRSLGFEPEAEGFRRYLSDD